MIFDDETIDVMIAGYLSRDAAHDDFESVLRCGGYLHGATVVSKDLEGNLSVEQTDHMVREGAASDGHGRVRHGPVRAATAAGVDRRRRRHGCRHGDAAAPSSPRTNSSNGPVPQSPSVGPG